MNRFRAKHKEFLFVLLLAGACLYLTFNKHSKTNHKDYHSFLWADAAGYYSYLPGLFIYDFEKENYPSPIQKETGMGFYEYAASGKMYSKYSYGVALLQAPFFLIGHGVASLTKYPPNGFSPPYQYLMMIASSFYFFLGLLFLKKSLRMFYSSAVTLTSLFFLVAGTNLFYYVADDGAYSHVFSFFLFALFIRLSLRYLNRPGTKILVAMAFVLGFMTLIRPTNFILVIFPLFFRGKGFIRVRERINFLFSSPLRVAGILLLFCLPFIPQLAFWKYITGKWFFYSYGGEGFSNLTSPRLLEVWFSPHNGLFPYSTLMIFIFAGMVWMVWEKRKNGWFFLSVFLLISYIFASWWMWYFGCSFGARSFVEYYALFAFPLAFWVAKLFSARSNLLKGFLVSLMVGFTVWNLFLSYRFDECWYFGDWDWGNYFGLIF